MNTLFDSTPIHLNPFSVILNAPAIPSLGSGRGVSKGSNLDTLVTHPPSFRMHINLCVHSCLVVLRLPNGPNMTTYINFFSNPIQALYYTVDPIYVTKKTSKLSQWSNFSPQTGSRSPTSTLQTFKFNSVTVSFYICANFFLDTAISQWLWRHPFN